jgi:hypothetical protein
MKYKIIALVFLVPLPMIAGGLPVYDTVRHAYDSLRDITQFAQDVQNMTNNLKNLEMNTAIRTINGDLRKMEGWADEVGIDTTELGIDEIQDILYESQKSSKDVERVRKRNDDVFGKIDRATHTVDRLIGQDAYKKHDKKREFFNEYMLAHEAFEKKRMRLMEERYNLSVALDEAETTAQVRKFTGGIVSVNGQLASLKNQEDALYRKYQLELKNMDVDSSERNTTAVVEKERLFKQYRKDSREQRSEEMKQIHLDDQNQMDDILKQQLK